jgi:hypothetical protein
MGVQALIAARNMRRLCAKRIPRRIVRGTREATWRWDWSCRELARTRAHVTNFLLIRSDIRLRSRADVDFIGPRRRCGTAAPGTLRSPIGICLLRDRSRPAVTFVNMLRRPSISVRLP